MKINARYIPSGGAHLTGSHNFGAPPATVAFWFRMDNTGLGSRSIYWCGRNDASNNFYVVGILGSDQLFCQARNTAGVLATATPTLTVGRWYHAAAVWRGSADRSIFLDGVEYNNTDSETNPTTNESSWGTAEDTSPNTNFKGAIALPAVWGDVALSASQIRLLADGVLPRELGAVTEQFNYWRFSSPGAEPAFGQDPTPVSYTVAGGTVGVAPFPRSLLRGGRLKLRPTEAAALTHGVAPRRVLELP